MSPHLRCETHRDGFVCRVNFVETIALNQTRQVKRGRRTRRMVAKLEVGRYLHIVPSNASKWKPGDTMRMVSVAWNFNFDPSAANVAFQEAKGKLRVEAERQADQKKLTGDTRSSFVEARIKSLAMVRAKEVLSSRDVVLLDQLRRTKRRLAVQGALGNTSHGGGKASCD